MRIWQRPYRDCYCAFCRRPRRVYAKRHLTWTDVAALFILAAVLSYAVWRALEPKGLLIFVALVGVGEFVMQMRWRVGLPCSVCGFDPVLYKRNPELAGAKVRDFYSRRRDRPDFLLTSHSLIETYRRIQEAKRRQARMERKRPLAAKAGPPMQAQ